MHALVHAGLRPDTLHLAIQGILLMADWRLPLFYVEAEPEHNGLAMSLVLEGVRECWGLEVMPEDECPADVLDSGRVRVYLAQIREATLLQAPVHYAR